MMILSSLLITCLLHSLPVHGSDNVDKGITTSNSAVVDSYTNPNEKLHILHVFLTMMVHSNFCLFAKINHRDNNNNSRLTLREAQLVRCSVVEPFCNVIVDKKQVILGCVEANGTTMKLFKNYLLSNTKSGNVVCGNVVCQIQELIAIGMPDVYQAFIWKFLDWMDDVKTKYKNEDTLLQQNKKNEISDSSRLALTSVAAGIIVAVGGLILGIVRYKMKKRNKYKAIGRHLAKTEIAKNPEVALGGISNLQEKTESQAKMTQL